MRLFFLILFSCSIDTGCSAQPISKDSLLVIIIQGPVKPVESYRIIASKYGFKYSGSACDGDSVYLNKNKRHNDSVHSLLEIMYGKDWNHTFQKDADALYDKEKKAIKLIDEAKIMINNVLLCEEDLSLQYRLLVLSENELQFVFYKETYYVQKTYVEEYGKIKVDLKKNIALLTDKKIHSYYISQ